VKYVALLAFNRIVLTHPILVTQQEDVIMDCLDSIDITIRLRALDLVVGMVNSENLMSIVGRLMRQLRNSPVTSADAQDGDGRASPQSLVPRADSDDEGPEMGIKSKTGADSTPLLPDNYKIDVIRRILEMCSGQNYANLLDFDWYIDVLLQLVRNSPVSTTGSSDNLILRESTSTDVSEKVGDELRNVAVKVKAVRASATGAAESIINASYNGTLSQVGAGKGALRPAVWIAGEYAVYLSNPEDVLTALLQLSKSTSNAETLAVYIQCILKIISLLVGDEQSLWTPERKTIMSLLMARVLHTLEPLGMHPDLEVQERAVEFTELLRLAAEASAGQDTSSDTVEQDAPLLLTQAIPSLFSGLELNSVAPGAQRNVPVPTGLDLEQPINPRLSELLRATESAVSDETDKDDFQIYYHEPIPVNTVSSLEPAISRLAVKEKKDDASPSYQGSEDSYLDPDIVARRRAERQERYKDDPFYIAPSEGRSGASTPLHNILKNDNGTDLDIDSIPIMQLDLGNTISTLPDVSRPRPSSRIRQRIQVAADETLGTSGTSTPRNEDSDTSLNGPSKSRVAKVKQSLLHVDSSSIGNFSLEGEDNRNSGPLDFERQQLEDAEMAKAMREVEKLRLEMQRANERIQAAQDVPVEGTIVKKKAKKKTKVPVLGEEEAPKPKKKKKVKQQDEGAVGAEEAKVIKKKKNVRKAVFEDDKSVAELINVEEGS
jgi:AP-3 complex subunit delta-1